jgi:geranylgeranyl diphosphate synthase type II
MKMENPTMTGANWEQFQSDGRLIETKLSQYFAARPRWGVLYEAMEYSLLAGGKRIRPALSLAFCRLFGGPVERVLPMACAVEMIHTYSLIHDDLPCMDDDDYRRGKLTCHKVYGEAIAVLAGDGLLTAAFETLLDPAFTEVTREQAGEAAFVLAKAAGHSGMIGGQTLDMMEMEQTEQGILELHRKKTGALLRAAAELGCIAAGAGKEERSAAVSYAEHLGLAFQIQDDLLDAEGDPKVMGKQTGSDQAAGKQTFFTLLGPDACRLRIQKETALAKQALSAWKGRDYLCALADWLASRTY